TIRKGVVASAPSGTSHATSAPPRARYHRPAPSGQAWVPSSEAKPASLRRRRASATAWKGDGAFEMKASRSNASVTEGKLQVLRYPLEGQSGPRLVSSNLRIGPTASPPAVPPHVTDARNHTPMRTSPPPAQGLYDPRFEHDACGVAFVVDMHGRRTHQLVE